MARDRIHVDELRIDCIVGIHPRERTTVQPLVVDLELAIDTSEAAYAGRIAATCDYARVCSEVEAMLGFRDYRLLEVAAEELAAMILGIHRNLHGLRLRLTKPLALEGRARGVGIEIQREQRDFPTIQDRGLLGSVEVLHRTRDVDLQLVEVVVSDASDPVRPGWERLEWLIRGSISRDGVRLPACVPFVSQPMGHSYSKLETESATLFRCEKAKQSS